MSPVFEPFRRWLEWLDSHDGRIHRRVKLGQKETDGDLACCIPTPPGQTIFTVGDLRKLVQAGARLQELERQLQHNIAQQQEGEMARKQTPEPEYDEYGLTEQDWDHLANTIDAIVQGPGPFREKAEHVKSKLEQRSSDGNLEEFVSWFQED